MPSKLTLPALCLYLSFCNIHDKLFLTMQYNYKKKKLTQLFDPKSNVLEIYIGAINSLLFEIYGKNCFGVTATCQEKKIYWILLCGIKR